MSIQEKLDSLQPYVISIRYAKGVPVIDAVFKEGWKVPKSSVISINRDKEVKDYYMFYSEKEGIGIDELLSYVENVIKINVEAENKFELLKLKVLELRELFANTTLSELQSLKFTLSSNELLPEVMSEEDILLKDLDKEIVPSETIVEQSPEIKEEPIAVPTHAEGQQKLVHVDNSKDADIVKFAGIELPPKDKKVVLETFELPPDMVEGDCQCAEDEYCPKCMDNKGL